MEGPRLSGIGMTSARTRERLVQRLQDLGFYTGLVDGYFGTGTTPGAASRASAISA